MKNPRWAIVAAIGLTVLAAPFGAEASGVRLPVTKTVLLQNGAKIILAEKHDVPLIEFVAYIRGGSLTDPIGKEGLAELTAEMLRRGAGKRSAQQIADLADGVGAEFDTGTNVEISWASGEFLARDQGLMIELLTDVLLRPSFPDSEFAKLKQQSIDAIRSEKDDPTNVLGDYGRGYFFGGHPYGRPLDGDETTLEAITRDDLLASYRANYGGDRLILSVVGDFNASRMEAALHSAFGDWRKAPGSLPIIAAPSPVEGRRVLLVDKPDATQTYFWIGNLGIARTDPDRNILDVANTYFGGRFTSMLNLELRLRSGLTYGVRCSIPRYAEPGPLAIVSYTKTEWTRRAIDLSLATLEKFRSAGLDSTAIASVKSYITGLNPTGLETGDQIAGRLADLALYDLGTDEVTGYADRIGAVTDSELDRVIRRVYPDPKNLSIVLIGNAAAIRSVARRYGPVIEARFDQPLIATVRRARPPAH